MTEKNRRTAGSPSKPMVYVVDPDEAVRESLRVLLATFGVTAEGFPDAEAFLAAFAGGRPGCLVTEVDLPGRDGVALIEHLNARDLSLPAIVVARNGDVGSAVRAMRAGAVDYLEKPFVDRVLVERLFQILADQSAAASRAEKALF